ncbi:MAG TPA: FixH family protein [Sulfuriferula sp.]|nr:FixH family protein [Sulfuriferula sp.]
MSLLETLFGGTVIVVILHWLLGRIGLATYWRGVISGALPTIAYAFYAVTKGDGLDVIAIHVAIFLATATVLSLLASDKSNSGKRMHWVPKSLAVFFGLLAVIDGAFVTISTQGVPPWVASMIMPRAKDHPVYSGFSGVTEHNDQAAKAVNEHLKMLSDEQKLGWEVEMIGLDTLKAGPAASNKLAMRLHDRQKQPLQNAVVTLSFFRPGYVQTLPLLQLQQNKPGEYDGSISIPDTGSWVVKLVIEVDGKRIEREHDVSVAAS